MASDVTRDEFDRLATRTDILEREVEGEKLVTRHALEHTRRNTEDLSALRSKVDGLDRKVDGLDRKFDDLRDEFRDLGRKFDDQQKNLPRIVGDVMRVS
jgi:uncharacterized protein YoxC